MQYKLQLKRTAAAVGYFACRPVPAMTFEEALDYLRDHPHDDFMHKYVLETLSDFTLEEVRELLAGEATTDPVLAALLVEAIGSFAELDSLRPELVDFNLNELVRHTPLIDIRAMLDRESDLHRTWMERFAANILEHQPLPVPGENGLKPLFTPEQLDESARGSVSLRQVWEGLTVKSMPVGEPPPAPELIAQIALERLEALRVIASIEARHAASLSPHALFRQWRLELRVDSGRHHYTLAGMQTSYGRGLTMAAARASCAMEMVERCSAFASFGAEGAEGYTTACTLRYAALGELREQGVAALDPNRLALEVPYRNEPLYWLQGMQQGEEGLTPVMVPAQCVFLFCNLDEVGLFSGLGSTGLASGSSIEQARLNGLLEAIERDAEAVVPFHVTKCFTLTADHPQVSGLLADYAAKGIHVQFQELTSELGVSCYKCFVIGPDGTISKGTGAHLDGRRALLSAMTETPYAYPYGPPSGPGLEGLPEVRFEDLPCYATGNPAHDLMLLETLLSANGYAPVYVDLTRSDLQIPVVKALIPGLELVADFDRFARVSKRLYANYLEALRQ